MPASLPLASLGRHLLRSVLRVSLPVQDLPRLLPGADALRHTAFGDVEMLLRPADAETPQPRRRCTRPYDEALFHP